jgi:hypothetical protein
MAFSDKVGLWRRAQSAAQVVISFEFYVEISGLNGYERDSQIANSRLPGGNK